MSALISLHRIEAASMKVNKFDGGQPFATLEINTGGMDGDYTVTSFWARDMAERLERAAAAFNAAMAEPAEIAEAAE